MSGPFTDFSPEIVIFITPLLLHIESLNPVYDFLNYAWRP